MRQSVKRYWIQKWCKRLGIKTKIRAEFVPQEMIECDYKIRYRLVCIDIPGATIYHDRRLTELDVVHELLHFKYPRYRESTIRRLTNEKMQKG